MSQNSTRKTILKKNLIAKKKIRVFDIGGKKLIQYQTKFRKLLEKYLKREQSKWLEFVDTIPELKFAVSKSINVRLLKVRLSKSFQEDFQQSTTEFVAGAMQEGVKNFVKEQDKQWVTLSQGFGIANHEVDFYAQSRSGQLIKNLDAVTKERVSNLIAESIKNGDGVGTLKKKLLWLYSFSKYRAGLIASTELGQAYSHGKRQAFENTLAYYGTTQGYKKAIIHKDDRTCTICLPAWNDGWIPFANNFSNWLSQTLFHVWCRCDVAYSLVNPDAPIVETPPKVLYKPDQQVVDTPPMEVPDFNTVKEVDEYMKKTFFGASSLSGITPSVGKTIAQALEDFNRTFPSVFGDSYKIPLLKSNTRTKSRAFIRSTRSMSENLEFWVSKKHFKTSRVGAGIREERLRNIEKREKHASDFEAQGLAEKVPKAQAIIDKYRNEADFWTIWEKYTTNPWLPNRATIMHELWHVVDNRLRNAIKKLKALWPLTTEEQQKYETLIGLYTKRNGAYDEFLAAIKSWKNKLSHYWAKNNEEFFAESMSAYMMGEYDHLYPKVKEFLDGLAKFSTLF